MQRAKKSPVTVMQHIIPVMHLNRFAGIDPKGHVWTYPKHGGEPRSGIPDAIGAERHFYSYENEDGTHDTWVEQTLSRVESSAEEPYRKLLRAEIPKGAERVAFAGFLATMYFRTRPARRMAAEMQSRFVQLKTYATANHPGAFETLIRKFEAEENKTLSAEERSTLKAVMLDPSGYELLMPKHRTLDIFEKAKLIAPLLHDMTWTIAEPAHGFVITSDQPVCRVVLTGAARHQEFGFKDKDVEVSFPLSPKRLLLMSWNKGLPNIFVAGREFIMDRNALRVQHAEGEIYSHIKHIQVERLVARYKTHRLDMAGGTMPNQKLMPVRVPRRWSWDKPKD